ncbi:MAG TPA: class I SAM-dependent methyltransferase [Smithellaceae bacterium]|nr:class I SAM-dependent methyltransferase [Smithellaceae bacterium]HRS88623.1 class I SAM-dependent methyltransferase [Smithellaceae bacterium]HRV25903.1 class I SAM-dependent methyltransferase [Smithellaceae bacterium]
MNYRLSTTEHYHTHELDTLGWELTVGNALYPENSPCRRILKTKASLGVNLYRFLEKYIPFSAVRDILEIGGGMGYLLRDFLELNPNIRATALDISPHLLNRQKETLQKYNVEFIQADVLKKDAAFFSRFDLIILNEIMGDFPALIPQNNFPSDKTEDLIYFESQAKHFANEYDISFAPDEAINIGALTLLENICRAGVQYVYLSEHSCEAAPPDDLRNMLQITPAGMPERITLKGHDEYTIKFSYLQKIAVAFNHKVRRGPIADFLPLKFCDKLTAIMRVKTPATDEQEIIQQFVYDLYKYEYLLLIK